MRHRVSSKRLKRSSGELKALLKNQASQLFERGSVTTTLPKAKILRPFAEKLVTLAKDIGFNSVKKVKAVLVNDSVVRNLFENVAPKFLQRPGGYTRIVKLGVRQGDNAPMARIELVENTAKSLSPRSDKGKNAKN
ncbi:MAG: 50S ribosomal protein L17 [Patescibacteria group bacterium]